MKTAKHRFYVYVLCLMPLIPACRHSQARRRSAIKTELGPGNDEVAQRFQAYKRKKAHCNAPSHADVRVLLGSFGPFSGQPINTSSLVAMNFGKILNDPTVALDNPVIREEDGDAVITESVVSIGGKRVAVCAVNAAVVWDLAAAIYLFEANIFKPDMIILSGMDGGNRKIGTWEQYARNVARGLDGYDRHGQSDGIKPQTDGEELIQIHPGGPNEITMTWDADAILAATSPMVHDSLPGFELQTSPAENPGTYLCNNVSYAVLTALRGERLSLAGGKMIAFADDLKNAHAGFFHYPWTSPQDAETVKLWVHVLAKAIRADLGI